MNINIDELSKLAFEEVQKELSVKKENIDNKIQETISHDAFNDEKIIISENEKIYLKKIRERILVLFEALNTKQNEEDLAKRLDLTITFIEFLLANIEERLKD